MTLKCVIIDDEPLAASLIKSYVEKTDFLSLTGVYNSAIEAMRQLREEPADIVFLDIQMPELSGMEFARLLPPQTGIIFTTAFSQYAIEGYEVNTIGYLLKPISYQAFIKVAGKALLTKTASSSGTTKAATGCGTTTLNTAPRFIFVKSDYKLVRVNLDDIIYIEGQKDYVRIYLADGSKITSLLNMKNIEESLPSPEFLRVHRSYIVHTPQIDVADKQRIIAGGHHIPIGDSYKAQVQEFLDVKTLG